METVKCFRKEEKVTVVQLNNKGWGRFEIPKGNLVGDFSVAFSGCNPLSDQEISDRLAHPIGTKSLKEMAEGKRNVLIVTDDNTRPTPLKRLLPHIFRELSSAGIGREQTRILIGLGTHRPMSEGEIEEKFGRQFSKEYEIMNHAWDDPGQLENIGMISPGIEVVVNRLALESDFIVAVGNIIPHATAGFSGGGKVIMPGICGETTIADTHWKALDFPMGDILGVRRNPIRSSIVEVCRNIGVDFVVDTVLAGDSVADVVAGDVEAAHEVGAEKSRAIYGIEVPEKADIVVAEGYPTDIDLRQAIKGICSADIVAKDGGVILLVAECPEGISPQFPDFEEVGFSHPEWLFEEVETGRFSNKLLAYTLVAIGRIISNRVKGILVCPNIRRERAEKMGFIHAGNLQEGIREAFRMAGPEARVAVLRRAGELLPLLKDKERKKR